MIEAFFSGTAGLSAHQNSLDIVANNIANVNTNGYKTKRQDFGNLFYASVVRPETRNSDILLAGAGSAVNDVKTDMSAGIVNETETPTDFYIDGDGYFAVRDNAGNTYYTRDGSFHAMQSANGMVLGTNDGLTVLDSNGNAIPVTAGSVGAAPGVFTFPNSSGLLSAGDNLFVANNVSGAAVRSNATPLQGKVERSNVDLADQMTKMIISQRGYQMNSGVVSTANQIEEMINELNK